MCRSCIAEIRHIDHPMCIICGRPFNTEGPDHACGECSHKRPPFDRARSARVFSGAPRRIILNFKFGMRTPLVKHLGQWMTSTLLDEFDPNEIDCIIPVPLHVKRLRWRGFNQALLLSREISSATGLWVDPYSLKRIRETRQQTRLPFKERRENVKGAFAVARETFVIDRSILLVDDVYTSGATLVECARVLKIEAGAARVVALTAARAISDISPCSKSK